MRKILSLMLFLLLVMSLTATDSLADTGTYRILDYSVTLNPKATGEIIMDYSQTWLVTGGNIPWVTIGLPNAELPSNRLGRCSEDGQKATMRGTGMARGQI